MTPRNASLLPLALVAALALSGCKKDTAPADNMAGANTGAAMTDTNVVDSDSLGAASTPEFISRLAMSDMYEIEAAKIALKRAQNPEMRKFAQMMIDDHGASSTELKTLATDGKLGPLPVSLDDEHNDKLEALRSADKDDFDGTYADQQRSAHESAVDLLEGYGAGGDNAALKAFAQKLLPKVRAHLDRIKTLDDAGADEAPKDRY